MTYGEVIEAYQTAIGTALKAYGGLTTLVPVASIGDTFMDVVPYPYIVYRGIEVINEDGDASINEARGTRLRRLNLTMWIIDESGDKIRSAQIAKNIELALDTTLTLSYGTPIEKTRLQGEPRIDPDDEGGVWRTTIIATTRIANI